MHLVKPLLVLASATPLVIAGPRGHPLRRRAGNDDTDSSSSFLPTTGLTPSSSLSTKDQTSLAFVGTAPLGTGISRASGTTQEVVITDVVYTTLTTCPVTSLVTSGSTSFEEVTTTISTLTRTSTSTLCTKCVAPPSKPIVSATSPAETAVSSLSSIIIFPLSQSSLPLSPTSPVPLQTAVSSKLETPGTAAPLNTTLVFPTSVSLTVSVASGASSTLDFPGYGIVPSPISTAGSPRELFNSNSTSSIIPVYTAALLGNAYGGGFVSTPSVYVTKLPYPNGPSSGVPPGYGSESSITIIESNVTAVFTGLGALSTSAASLKSMAEVGVPAFTASIASNASVLFGNFSPSTSSTTSSGIKGSTPTFVSLSPFGGRISLISGSNSVPSLAALSSYSSAAVGGEASSIPSFTALITVGNSQSNGSSVITALIAATSPAGALISEVSQLSNAVLSSLAAVAVPTSPVNAPNAVFSSSTTSIIGLSIETAGFNFTTSAFVGGAPFLPTIITVSPTSPGQSSLQAITTTENSGSSATSAAVLAGAPEASTIPTITVSEAGLSSTLSNSGNNDEASSTSSPTSGEIRANIIPSLPAEESAGPLVTLAVGSLAEQTPATGQPATSLPTPIVLASSTTKFGIIPSPVIGANGQISSAGQPASSPTPVIGANGQVSAAGQPASSPTPIIGANGQISAAGQPASSPTPIISANSQIPVAGQPAVSSPSPVINANGQVLAAGQSAASSPSPVINANGQVLAAGQSAASSPTPIIVANSSIGIAVVPSPVVGANGLTSLAVFSTPIAPAAGLTTPAVLLTPIVGANGLTSLAVLATPVVGANGLTSLAIGFETETSPAAGQSNSASSPVENFILVESPPSVPQVSGGIPTQAKTSASGVSSVIVSSGPAESPIPGGSGAGNYSIHVLLNPTAATHFQGSAAKLSLGFGVGFIGCMVFLILL